jgi:GAF domain-containing protein
LALESTSHFSAAAFARLVSLYRLSVGLHAAGDETGIFRGLEQGLGGLGLTSFVGRYEAESQSIRVFATATLASPVSPGASPPGESPPRPIAGAAYVEPAIRAHEAAFLESAAELAGLLPVVGRTVAERRRTLLGLGAAAVVPMVVHGRTSGVLFVLGRGLQAHEAALLRELADHLAVALDAAAILRDLKQALLREHAAASELRRLEALVAELSAEREPEALLRRVVNATAEALDVGRVAVYLLEQASPEPVLAAAVGLESDVGARLGEVLRGQDLGATLVVADLSAEPAWSALAAVAEGASIRSAWLLPLVSREGERLGAVVVLSERVGGPASEQLELAERYAGHAARAIAAGRQQEREALAARTAALADLARSIPHELGQPLAIIAGYAELIAEGRLQGEALRDACRELVAAANNLGDLVQRLERITSYATKEYGPGRVVIDFERAAGEEPSGGGPPEAPAG